MYGTQLTPKQIDMIDLDYYWLIWIVYIWDIDYFSSSYNSKC